MEEMEMPTVCDCGNVFDLHDGFANHNRTITICEDCARVNEKRDEYISQLDSWFSKIEELQEEIHEYEELIKEYKDCLKGMPEHK